MGMILIVEDDPSVLDSLDLILDGLQYTILVATTFQEVLDRLPNLKAPLVALVDEDFSGGDGAQVAQVLRENIPGVKLISTSAREGRFILWEPDARFQKPNIPYKGLRATIAALLMESTS